MQFFDPNAPAPPDSGVFGLPFSPEESQVVLLPVPFEATTSYGGGTADGPRAILEASRQVDLYDLETGRPYEAGICMMPELPEIRAWNEEAAVLARRSRDMPERGGSANPDIFQVNVLCARLNTLVYTQVGSMLERGKRVGSIGGDHGAVYGAIQAHVERYPGLGILHFDAHADLRPAYEGFEWSHASIMHNVTKRLPGLGRLVQVGLRDLSEEEREQIETSDGKVRAYYDAELARHRFEGATWGQQVARIVQDLPEQVYVSLDVDGLDPAFCPHTGTPVPGGLTFQQTNYLLGAVARSGRHIVGFDLVEVAPGPPGDEWDANVGARLLYKLIGWMLVSQQ